MSEMRWYHPLGDTNTHRHAFVADHVDLTDSNEWDLTEGKPLARWKKVTFWTDDEECDGIPDDALQHCVVRLPVFSQRLRQALEDGGISGIQFLPVEVKRPSGNLIEGYSVANITVLLSALDAKKSVLTRYGESRPDRLGEISGIMKPVLRKRVVVGHDIFRLAEFPLAYFVSNRFREIFLKGGFSGYSFREVPLS